MGSLVRSWWLLCWQSRGLRIFQRQNLATSSWISSVEKLKLRRLGTPAKFVCWGKMVRDNVGTSNESNSCPRMGKHSYCEWLGMWTPKPGLVPVSICLFNPCLSPLSSAQGYQTASFDRSLHPGKRSMDILTPPGILPLNLFQDL